MAKYSTIGVISEMSGVSTNTSKKGNQYEVLTFTLEVYGYRGAVTKQVFNVFGSDIKDVLLHNIGDKVEVIWEMYARPSDTTGQLYNRIDFCYMRDPEGETPATPAEQTPDTPVEESNPVGLDDLPF